MEDQNRLNQVFFQLIRYRILWNNIITQMGDIHRRLRYLDSPTYNYYTVPIHLMLMHNNKSLLISTLELFDVYQDEAEEVKRLEKRRGHTDAELKDLRYSIVSGMRYSSILDLKLYKALVPKFITNEHEGLIAGVANNNNLGYQVIIDIIKYKRATLESSNIDQYTKNYYIYDLQIYKHPRLLKEWPHLMEYQIREYEWSNNHNRDTLDTLIEDVTDSRSMDAIWVTIDTLVKMQKEKNDSNDINEKEYVKSLFKEYPFVHYITSTTHLPVFQQLNERYGGNFIPLRLNEYEIGFRRPNRGFFNLKALYAAGRTPTCKEAYEYLLDLFLADTNIVPFLPVAQLLMEICKRYNLYTIYYTFIRLLNQNKNTQNPKLKLAKKVGTHCTPLILHLISLKQHGLDETTKHKSSQIDPVLQLLNYLMTHFPSAGFKAKDIERVRSLKLGLLDKTTIESLHQPLLIEKQKMEFNNINNDLLYIEDE